MNLSECYAMMEGNYEEAKGRLLNKDSLVEKYILKFLDDSSMQMLRDGLAAEDYDMAFEGAHKLKGVVANLAFTRLLKSAALLSDTLKAERKKPDAALVEQVEADYALTTDVIRQYANGL